MGKGASLHKAGSRSNVGRGISCRRANVNWRALSLPALPVGKGLNIRFAGTEEVQKVHTHVFAGLTGAQKDEVFLDSFGCGHRLNRPTWPRERLYRILRVVVVPGNTI